MIPFFILYCCVALLLLLCFYLSMWLFSSLRKILAHWANIEHSLFPYRQPNEITCGWVNEWELDSLGAFRFSVIQIRIVNAFTRIKCEPPWFSYTLSIIIIFFFSLCFWFSCSLFFAFTRRYTHSFVGYYYYYFGFFFFFFCSFLLLHQFNETATHIHRIVSHRIVSHLLTVCIHIHWFDAILMPFAL